MPVAFPKLGLSLYEDETMSGKSWGSNTEKNISTGNYRGFTGIIHVNKGYQRFFDLFSESYKRM
jgi:hypothetical protein